jgi:hypothetical protein
LALEDFVDVNISIQDAVPTAIEFNTPLILAKAPYLGGRLYNCSPSGLSAMITDGFNTYDRAYQEVATMAAQQGGAGKAYVYSRTTQQTHILDLTPTITTIGYVYAFDITYQGVTSSISHTVSVATVDAICDALEAAIDASLAGLAGIGVAPDNATATKLTLTADVAGDFILIDGIPAGLSVEDVSVDGSVAAQLTAAQAALGEAFYGLLLDGFSESEGNLAAAFAESNLKICLLGSPDQEILESGQSDDLASDLKTAGYNRSAVFMTRQMSANEAAGLLGRQLGRTPGSSNWQKRRLTGVSASSFSETEITNANTKRAILYSGERSIAFTRRGSAASGRAFDLTHGVDKMKADIETEILLTMVNNERISYDADGLAQIKAAIDGVLARNEAAKFIAPGWFVTMPDLALISDAQKALRTLPAIEFHAVATGAIDSVTVNGTITL